jgi:DNA-binding IclR family transcriptional regulator
MRRRAGFIPARAYTGTQSVRRAIITLKIFSDERPEWGLTEISRQARLNKTTAYRLLTALEAEGWWQDHRRGWVAPRRRTIALGALALRSNDLSHHRAGELAEQFARRARRDPERSLVGDEVLIVDAAEASVVGAEADRDRAGRRTRRRPGRRCSRPGWTAGMNRRSREVQTSRAAAEKVTSRTITDPTRLRASGRISAERGWAAAIEELKPVYVAVGAPSTTTRQGRSGDQHRRPCHEAY